MNFLLDTCVLSEVVRPKPDKKVIAWLKKQDEETLYISALTFGEIHKGIAKLPSSRRKEPLHQWVEHDLRDRFRNRVLDVTLAVAKVWGKIQGKSELEGQPLPAIAGLIAATALAHGLTVVTRNTVDMEQSGVALLNPWA